MAAVVALMLLWIGASSTQVRPLLLEAGRIEIPRTVRFLTVSISGHWYAADPEEHSVLKFSAAGVMESSVGGYGWGLFALDHPTGIATDGNRVYVADRGNHRIVFYDRELRPLGSLATRDSSERRARFGLPKAVAVSGRGDLVVLDGESDEIVGFRPDGRVAFRIGRDVPGGSALDAPTCLAVSRQEQLIVGETGGVRIFDLFGTELRRVEVGPETILRGVSSSGTWLAAVSADTLYLARDVDGVVYRWPRRSIVPDVTLDELWGVAWEGERLLVLSGGAIIRLDVEG